MLCWLLVARNYILDIFVLLLKKIRMKKRAIIFSMFILHCAFANAQIENPVKWNYETKKIGEKVYELHFKAMIDANWHLYSQDAGEDIVSTIFKFIANPLVKFDGKVFESGELKKLYDPNLRLTLNFYNQQVDFSQKIKIKSLANTLVNGSITYVACNDKKCLPAKEFPFSIKIVGK
jgi:hypothetical protein